MANKFQPLVNNQPIVNEDGTPTQYFIRWAQQRQIDIQGSITGEQAMQLIEDWSAQRDIIAGVGLDGGGPLSADVTLNLENTLVVPGTYGDASNVPRLVIDAQGRVQAATQVPVSGGGGGGGSGRTPVIAGTTFVNASTATISVPPIEGTQVGDRFIVFCAGQFAWTWAVDRGLIANTNQSNVNIGVFSGVYTTVANVSVTQQQAGVATVFLALLKPGEFFSTDSFVTNSSASATNQIYSIPVLGATNALNLQFAAVRNGSAITANQGTILQQRSPGAAINATLTSLKVEAGIRPVTLFDRGATANAAWAAMTVSLPPV